MLELRRITVTFSRNAVQYAVTYAPEGERVATPGSKQRTTRAARSASNGRVPLRAVYLTPKSRGL
jgi:hypothetical protein